MIKMKRAVHFDFHTIPGVYDLGVNFDAKKFAKMLQDSHVGYINFFARCNRGHSYYPTKIGTPYPSLGDKDLLGDMIRECHKLNIGVTAYVNAVLNYATAEKHPDWRVHDKDGNPQGISQMCYNTKYGDHLQAEIAEILNMYPDVDGIFADCLDLSPVCYCPECTRKMEQQGVDIEDINAVRAFDKRTKVHMAQRIRDVVPSSKYLYINGLQSIQSDRDTLTEDFHKKLITSPAEIEALPNGGCGFDCFPTQIAYNRHLFDQTVYMTGRFHQSWGDFGGIRTKAALEYDAYTAIAYGSEISIGDHLHPSGAPEKGLFDIIKPLYTDIEKIECWIDSQTYVPEIGVYCPIYQNKPGYNHFYERQNSYQGAQRILNELKYQYDIVTTLADLTPYKVLILPDDVVLDKKNAAKIEAYLNAVGKVLSTGFSGMKPDCESFALKNWAFTDCKKEGDLPTYFKLKNFLGNNAPDMVIRNYKPGIAFKGGKNLADHIPCYPVEKMLDFMYFPYEKPDGLSAAAVSGNVLHIGLRLFESYAENDYFVYKIMIKNALEHLYNEKLVTADLPSFARTSLMKTPAGYLLHVLSYCPEQRGSSATVEEPIELFNKTFTLRIPPAKAVISVPGKKSVPFMVSDGAITFTAPYINGHAMFVIEYKKI